MLIAILKPKVALAMLTKKNIKTFLSALKQEPAKNIEENLGNLAGSIETIQSVKNRPSQNILVHVDEAGILGGLIVITGWAIAKKGIEEVKLFFKESNIRYTAEYGKPRSKVGNIYPGYPDSNKSGFFFSKSPDLMEKEVTITVTSKDNKTETKLLKLIPLKNSTSLNIADQYKVFIHKNKLTNSEISNIVKACEEFDYQPKISVITPVYNVDPKWLNLCVTSLLKQYYKNWELCLFDDASTNKQTIHCLSKWQQKDKRIKVGFGEKNQHIVGASNRAVKMATGEFIGLLDNDDELTPDALYEVVKALNSNRELDLIYSDEDKLTLDGERTSPYFKPDFNLDLLRSNNYICHFTVIRKSIGDSFGWFRKGYEGAQDHDVILQAVDKTTPDNIYHIPKVLYHWRRIPGSTAESYGDKNYAFEAGRKAVQSHLERNNLNAKVEKNKIKGTYRVVWDYDPNQKISVIIPFKDNIVLLKNCLESILKNTVITNYEILLISNNSKESATFSYLKDISKRYSFIKFFEYNVPFNYSAINNWAVQKAKGSLILLLNNDTEVITRGWLKTLAGYCQRKDVGAVGCKLLFKDGAIQHAGVVVGLTGIAGHVFHGLHKDIIHHPSYGITKNVSACTAACLLVKKALYQEIGGLDEENLSVAFNDIDFCLKLREKQYLVIYTPEVELFHYESKTRGYEKTMDKVKRFKREIAFFENKWTAILEKGDPYYNKNLSRESSKYSLNLVVKEKAS